MIARNQFTAFAEIILITVLLLMFLSFKTSTQSNILIGTWEGEIKETKATLIFTGDNSGSINYYNYNHKFNFNYKIVNDSILRLQNGNLISKHIFKIKNNKSLSFYPIKEKDDIEATDLIYMFTFYKK